MKIMVSGHSASHPRQRRVWEWIGENTDHQIMVCGPLVWGDERYSHYTKKNFIFRPLNVMGQGIPANMVCYDQALTKLGHLP